MTSALHSHAANTPVRVACCGDSITYGDRIPDRETASYPAVLGTLLGAGYEVRNFGVCGATLLRNGDYPYWSLPEMDEACRFDPHIIVVMLGTNDSKPRNWMVHGEFEADLAAFLDRFAALPSKPKVWVCLPPPIFGAFNIPQNSALERRLIPALKGVCQARGIPLVNVRHALENRDDLFPDQVHPNEAGAKIIAETVRAQLVGK